MMQPPGSRSSKHIRLLIVDDMPDMAQNVRKLLHFEKDIEVIGVAANLAVALHKTSEKSVVLVDANLQSGDAHVLLNINQANSIDDLREAGSLDQDIINNAVAPHDSSGIGVLRAPLALESAELFTSDAMKAILVELREHFDYLVVDTDASFSESTLTVLEMADLILLVTTLELTTINRVSQFFEAMERLGYAPSMLKLASTRSNPLSGIQPPPIQTRPQHPF